MYTGLARNNKGFMELNTFLTMHNESGELFPERAPRLDDVWFIYNWGNKPSRLAENELIGIRPSDINKLISSPFGKKNGRLVMWHPVNFARKEEYEIHRHLRAIDHNTLLSKLVSAQQANEWDVFRPADLLCLAYSDYPEIIRNTESLVKDCSIYFDYKSIKNKATFTGSRYDDKVLLEKLAI
jgi:DNA polymerase-3 subunit alpha